MKKHIYLIKSNESDRYKIGISKNPKNRVKQLQTGNSEKLTLISSYESEYYKQIEVSLHNRFSHLKKEGEWFEFGIEQELGFLNECEKIEKSIKVLIDNDNHFIH